jgi:hypothetical protein
VDSTSENAATRIIGEPLLAPEKVRVGPLHPKRLAKMTGAIAGLACALSVVVGAVAARIAPHGLRGIAVSLHLVRQPLIVKIAAGIASLAVVAAALSGALHFYRWWREHDPD